MSILTIAIIILVLFFVQGIGLYLMLRRKEESGPVTDTGGMMLLQQQVQELAKTLDARVADSSKQMNDTMRSQLGESSRLIKEITQEITSVKEISRQTHGFAEQLQDLQNILTNPKQRGVLGEVFLDNVLKNVLPPGGYQMQYPFKNGEVVDAVVFIKDKIVPVDSKFSLENYNRLIAAPETERPALTKVFENDLKMRIVETAKYIRPEEGTMDFAFMFIPSEGIYYDLLTNKVGAGDDENLLQRAASKYRVIIVSPTSFLAYLQTVMQGLKALDIEQKAVEIQKKVGDLVKHINSTNSLYLKLGNALNTVVSHYNNGHKELAKVDKDVFRISGERADVEINQLERPILEIE